MMINRDLFLRKVFVWKCKLPSPPSSRRGRSFSCISSICSLFFNSYVPIYIPLLHLHASNFTMQASSYPQRTRPDIMRHRYLFNNPKTHLVIKCEQGRKTNLYLLPIPWIKLKEILRQIFPSSRSLYLCYLKIYRHIYAKKKKKKNVVSDSFGRNWVFTPKLNVQVKWHILSHVHLSLNSKYLYSFWKTWDIQNNEIKRKSKYKIIFLQNDENASYDFFSIKLGKDSW